MVKEKIKDAKEEAFRRTKELQNVLLAKKQGEALERVSTPFSSKEALSLGHYEAPTNVMLNALITTERLVNDICDIEGTEISDFSLNISRASANRNANRVVKVLETVGQLGQYRPGPPQFIPWNETDEPPEED